MSVTNTDVIRDALGLIGVLNEIQNPSAEQGAHGLRILNDMMNDWLGDSIDVQYYDQTDPTANIPAPASALAAIKPNLAMKLAPYYGKAISPDLRADAADTKSSLQRQSVIDSRQESKLNDLPLERTRYLRRTNILNG